MVSSARLLTLSALGSKAAMRAANASAACCSSPAGTHWLMRPPLHCNLGRHAVCRQHHPRCALARDRNLGGRPGQPGIAAEAQFRHADLDIVGGDCEVAHVDEREAATERRAVHGGDEHGRMLADRDVHVGPFLAGRMNAALDVLAALLQVDAGAETLAGSGQHDDAEAAPGMVERRQHAVAGAAVHRVALGLARDREDGVVALGAELDLLRRHGKCHRSLRAHSTMEKIGTLKAPRSSNLAATCWPMRMASLGASILLTTSAPSSSWINAQLYGRRSAKPAKYFW